MLERPFFSQTASFSVCAAIRTAIDGRGGWLDLPPPSSPPRTGIARTGGGANGKMRSRQGESAVDGGAWVGGGFGRLWGHGDSGRGGGDSARWSQVERADLRLVGRLKPRTRISCLIWDLSATGCGALGSWLPTHRPNPKSYSKSPASQCGRALSAALSKAGGNPPEPPEYRRCKFQTTNPRGSVYFPPCDVFERAMPAFSCAEKNKPLSF
jgi:hypothetical protein